MTNEIRELCIDELDTVSGGTWMDTVVAVVAAGAAITGINSVPTHAVDGIPPASCHPKG
jgi:hypothetical protein